MSNSLFCRGDNMTFSERLVYLRKKHNLTQQDVYTAIKMSSASYQRCENDRGTPSYKTLLTLADFFKVSIDYLVGRTDNPSIREDDSKEKLSEPILSPQMNNLQKKLLSVDSQIAAEVESYLNYLLQKNSSQDKAAESK